MAIIKSRKPEPEEMILYDEIKSVNSSGGNFYDSLVIYSQIYFLEHHFPNIGTWTVKWLISNGGCFIFYQQ